MLAGLSPKRRDCKTNRKHAAALENEWLRHENEPLTQRLKQAKRSSKFKNASKMVGIVLPSENGLND